MTAPDFLSYNLTYPEGMASAIVDFSVWKPERAHVLLAPFMPFLPEEILGPSFPETVLAMVRALWRHSGKTVHAQHTTAIELVNAGKEIGVSGINLCMHPEAGIIVGAHFEDLPVVIASGSAGEVVVKVEF